MMDKQDIKDAADELYGAGYNAAKLERDYDPRGCTEWQDVVDLVPGEQKPECPNCEGAGHIYEGGMSMNPEVDNKVPCPDCTITMIERELVNHFDVRKIETLITYLETIRGLVESEKLHYKSGSLAFQ